jgi:hypothetical protein
VSVRFLVKILSEKKLSFMMPEKHADKSIGRQLGRWFDKDGNLCKPPKPVQKGKGKDGKGKGKGEQKPVEIPPEDVGKWFEKGPPELLMRRWIETFWTNSEVTSVTAGKGQHLNATASIVLDKNKLLCHFIIYVLQNTPNGSLNFACIGKDLMIEGDEMRRKMEYCNCELSFFPGTQATLRSKFEPPTQSLASLEKGKGFGKGKKGKGKGKGGGKGKGKKGGA